MHLVLASSPAVDGNGVTWEPPRSDEWSNGLSQGSRKLKPSKEKVPEHRANTVAEIHHQQCQAILAQREEVMTNCRPVPELPI
jgi:hypothetical protein